MSHVATYGEDAKFLLGLVPDGELSVYGRSRVEALRKIATSESTPR